MWRRLASLQLREAATLTCDLPGFYQFFYYGVVYCAAIKILDHAASFSRKNGVMQFF